MKYIKKFEYYYNKVEQKELESLARRLTYHLKKYFSEDNKVYHKKGEYTIVTDQQIRADFCDNPHTPIQINLWSVDDLDKEAKFHEKLAEIKTGHRYDKYVKTSSVLLTRTEAQELFIYLKNAKMFDDSKKYNL